MKRLQLTICALALGLGTLGGCTHPPRPAALARAEQARQSPALEQARVLVPQAVAYAESLRQQAQTAYDQGSTASASLLAERSLVAFDRATALARVAQAQAVGRSAQKELETARAEQQVLQAEQARVTADIEALESQVRVYRDAEPVVPSGRADAQRQEARLQAAQAVLLDAHLLCLAALMLDKPVEGLSQQQAEVQRLQSVLEQKPRTVPIDACRRVRAQCLALLTQTRRAASFSLSAGASDVLLAELSSKTDLGPYRDDRGIVASLGLDPFSSEPAAKRRLEQLVASALAHPEYPVLLLGHSQAKGPSQDAAQLRAQLERLQALFVQAGVEQKRIRLESIADRAAGKAKTSAAGEGSGAGRLEIVFISPRP